MLRNHIFRNVNEALPVLCSDMMRFGLEVPSRLGETTRELRHVGITLTDPRVREVVVPHRKASHVAQIAESMWVLAGRSDIEWLSHYLPRAEQFSDDGKHWRGGYGPRLRRWNTRNLVGRTRIDQLQHVLDVLRADRNSRRAVVSIYDPRVDTQPGKDIPCNDFLNFSLRDGFLDLHVFIRSNDLIWGWSGINAFEWSVLLEIMAGMLGAEVGALHFSITSLHVYDRHYDRVRQIAAEAETEWDVKPSAGVAFDATGLDDMESLDVLLEQWFDAERLIREGHVAQAAQAIADFPEPMLQSYLDVLLRYWTTKKQRAMTDAASVGGGQPGSWSVDLPALPDSHVPGIPAVEAGSFADRVAALHAEKHAAYGDSWKKRGEAFSIMPNIARKVDRLGTGAETADESQVDTAIDLLVYLIKYRWWLTEEAGAPVPEPFTFTWPGEVDRVAATLAALPAGAQVMSEKRLVEDIHTAFGALEVDVLNGIPERWRIVDHLMDKANLLARHRDWQRGNAARRWVPQEVPEKVGAHGWPYRPTQPQREPHADATVPPADRSWVERVDPTDPKAWQ